MALRTYTGVVYVRDVSDLAKFHRGLFGLKAKIPARCMKLYAAYESHDARGFSSLNQTLVDLQAVTVVALFMASQAFEGVLLKDSEAVMILIPPAWNEWAVEKLKVLAAALIGLRKGNLLAIQAVRDAFGLLRLVERPRLLPPDSKKWVSIGYVKGANSVLPPWMQKKLV